MLQVERVHVEGVDQEARVADVEGGTVEVDLEPLVRVDVERVSKLDAAHQVPVLGTHERVARVRGVHVQPEAELLADEAQLEQVVEGAHAGGAQGGHHEEGHHALGLVVEDLLAQNGAAQATVVVALHGRYLDAAQQAGALHRRVGQVRAVADEPLHGAGRTVVVVVRVGHWRPLAQLGERPRARHQQRHQGGLARRAVDHAAPVARLAELEVAGQAQHVGQPVEHLHLELGAGRTGNLAVC